MGLARLGMADSCSGQPQSIDVTDEYHLPTTQQTEMAASHSLTIRAELVTQRRRWFRHPSGGAEPLTQPGSLAARHESLGRSARGSRCVRVGGSSLATDSMMIKGELGGVQ